MTLPRDLRTGRLLLRRWIPADRAPFAAMNADPRVMHYLPGPLSREDSDRFIGQIDAHFDRHGFGLWAVEVAELVPFAGFIGLSIPAFDAHFTPCVEIGWRLAAGQWGRGYATEGARAVLSFGFETLQLGEIVSFTVPDNLRSRRVMERIGMAYNPADDFDYPVRAGGPPPRRHVLYRVKRTPDSR